MGKIIQRSGDIFTSTVDAVGQGINTKGLMGAGIAKEFARIYPDMFKEYKDKCLKGEIKPGAAWVWEDPETSDIVLNIASQNKPGRDASLTWLRSGTLDAIQQLRHIRPATTVFALPRIGCGIGGLEWDDVLSILEDIAEQEDIDIEVWLQ